MSYFEEMTQQAREVVATAAESQEASAQAEGTVCPVCGKISDSKFCPHCGAPMGG